MPTRQERRRQERLAKKQGTTSSKYDMQVQLLQPWSVPVFKTKLPPDVLQTMIEISDQVIADKETETWGPNLAGQIDTELKIEHDILKQTGMMGFFMGAVRQFVLLCKMQQMPDKIDEIQREEWLTQMLTCWIVSQQPNEYNPCHIHTQCTISSVMYLKVPKMLPSRKDHRPDDDGSILFTNAAGRDHEFCTPNFNLVPKVGDFFIFTAHQYHAVYPYRCSVGDPERRSVSFNALFKSKSQHEQDLQNEKVQQEAYMKEIQDLPKDSRH